MVELFSKQPVNLELKFDTWLTPIHINESIISLFDKRKENGRWLFTHKNRNGHFV